MDSDNKMNVILSLVAGATLCFCVATITSCVREDNQAELNTISEAIAAGADPLTVRCAIDLTQRNEKVCLVKAAVGGAARAAVEHDPEPTYPNGEPCGSNKACVGIYHRRIALEQAEALAHERD